MVAQNTVGDCAQQMRCEQAVQAPANTQHRPKAWRTCGAEGCAHAGGVSGGGAGRRDADVLRQGARGARKDEADGGGAGEALQAARVEQDGGASGQDAAHPRGDGGGDGPGAQAGQDRQGRPRLPREGQRRRDTTGARLRRAVAAPLQPHGTAASCLETSRPWPRGSYSRTVHSMHAV